MRLTDLSVRALKNPIQGSSIFYDDTLPGFGVRVSQAGTKSFVLTHGSRRTRETIGRVGIISLSEARQEAKRRCAEYTLGKHRTRSVSWNTAREEFLGAKREILKAKTVYGYRIHLAYFPFGAMKLSEITATELQRDLARIKRKGQQRNTFACLRTFLRWAFKKDYVEHNPVDRMEPPKAGPPRKRILTDGELRKCLEHALAGTSPCHSIVALLALTGQRRSEIGALQWRAWRVCEKRRRPWLPDWRYERQHFGEATRRHYVFPAERNRFKDVTTFDGWSKCKIAFDAEIGLPHWTLHDLRRTFRTNWAELGVLEEVAEKYINHISGKHSGLGRIYNRAKYIVPMREAVSRWELHIQSILNT